MTPESHLSENAALLVIDVQEGFDDPKWGRRNNLDAEETIAGILKAWRASGRSVFHVKHNSRDIDSPLHSNRAGNKIKGVAVPLEGEAVIEKDVNSAFIGTDLESRLREARVKELVIVGLTTPHCVSTSARMAGNLGFATYVVSDAVAAFELQAHDGRTIAPDDVHYHALASIHGEFATVVSSSEIFMAL